jgi:hypothetical protein
MKEKVPSNGHLQVSRDGKSLAFTLGSLDPTGKTPPTVRNYIRLSGKSGLLGGWKNVDGDPSRLLKVTLSAHNITLETPFAHQSVTLPISGAEAHPMSNGVPSMNIESLQIDSPHMFRTVIRQMDGAVKQAVFKLSADGNTITETGWVQQHPEQIVSYTYRRSH